MKLLLITIIKNLAKMLLTQNMLLWGLEKYSKFTKNLIDDNIITIVNGALKSDVSMIKKGIEGLLVELNSVDNTVDKL